MTDTRATGFVPYDQNSNTIQVMQPVDSSVTVVNFTGTTGTTAISGISSNKLNIVEVAASDDVHMAFGGSGITAATSTSRYFPKGAAVYQLDETQTHVAVIAAAGASPGVLTVTPLI